MCGLERFVVFIFSSPNKGSTKLQNDNLKTNETTIEKKVSVVDFLLGGLAFLLTKIKNTQ
jgi:hypothetical protein